MSVADRQQPDRTQLEQLLEQASAIHGVSLWKDAARRLRANRVAMASIAFLLLMGLLALLTPLLPLQSPIDKDLNNRRFLPPNLTANVMGSRADLKFAGGTLTGQLQAFEDSIAPLYERLEASTDDSQRIKIAAEIRDRIDVEHPFNQLWNDLGPVSWLMCRMRVVVFGNYAVPSLFGTDKLGRDVLARVFWGARVSLIVGLVATLVSLVIGVSYGAIAGYFGGTIDALMMRLVDVLYSVPFIFVVIFLVTFLGEDNVRRRLDAVGIDQIMIFYIVIGAIYWLTMSRVVRGQVLSLRHEQFVEAARTVGASPLRIVFVASGSQRAGHRDCLPDADDPSGDVVRGLFVIPRSGSRAARCVLGIVAQ